MPVEAQFVHDLLWYNLLGRDIYGADVFTDGPGLVVLTPRKVLHKVARNWLQQDMKSVIQINVCSLQKEYSCALVYNHLHSTDYNYVVCFGHVRLVMVTHGLRLQ